jgi:translation initiation factor IF-3
VNHRIRVPEVRVIYEDEQLGILSRDEALRVAQEKGLDLVEIAARSNPPVCRIMDYGRFKYEQSKKQKAAKKHASTIEVKEVKFRPKTDQHDLDFKVKHVRRFLEEGNKCRLVVIFRGREVTHPETGVAVLDKVIARTSDIAQIDMRPNLEGKRMTMVIGPKAGVIRRAPKRTEKEEGDGAKPAAAAEKPAGGGGAEERPSPQAAEARED